MKTAHHGQLMLSIGALLASEREKRGIPVEKAAKETRMRPQRIRDMENDDLSHFTNPSYARMFIIAYAKYLGVPMQTIGDHLPDRGEPGTEGYQYISSPTDELPSLRNDIASKPARRSTLVSTLAVATFSVVLVGVIAVGCYLVVNAQRLQPDLDQSKRAAAAESTPPPKIIERVIVPEKTVVLDNLLPNGEKAAAFENEVALAEPHAPSVPTPSRRTESILTVTTGPTAEPEDDHAFLLGASPNQKPTPVQ